MLSIDTVNSKPILQGEYKLLKVLQRLPYSVYYLGTSLHNPNKRWAIKEIFLEFDSEEQQQQVFRFFEAICERYINLKHPNLAPLKNFFYENNNEYVVFEYIPGHRLQEIIELRKKPFTERQVINLAVTVANALEYMHGQKMIFHDLNPSNIIITPEGELKLTDYGLGKIIANREERQPLWGTMGYAPPEQFGRDAVLSQGVEVFALGVIMHEMLTFWPAALSAGVYPPVRKLNPGISRELETIIKNATYEDPFLRYATVKGFLNDLNKLNKQNSSDTQRREENWLTRLVREVTKPFLRTKDKE